MHHRGYRYHRRFAAPEIWLQKTLVPIWSTRARIGRCRALGHMLEHCLKHARYAHGGIFGEIVGRRASHSAKLGPTLTDLWPKSGTCWPTWAEQLPALGQHTGLNDLPSVWPGLAPGAQSFGQPLARFGRVLTPAFGRGHVLFRR